MTLISVKFFVFLCITVLVYYVLPIRYRWISLLIASVAFYLTGGMISVIVVFAICFFSYYMAIKIAEQEKGQKKKLILTISVVAFLTMMTCFKVYDYFETLADRIIVPVGISFFSLSIIGYLLDVYWKKEDAERNFGHYLVFVFYFPKIVQGPISRHSFLAKRIVEGHRFEYKNFCYALQLMLWGIFKKIVLADRMLIVVNSVYGSLSEYANHGIVLIITMIISAFQLYCDFSGYTDIALGVSGLFGIEMEGNFNHPFFSKSAAEFWQRWHISLSSWFKDYLFLPVSRSRFVKKISKSMGVRYGAIARKKTMMVCSTAVVWIATGLWHGTGVNYIVWGIYWGVIIIISEICHPIFEKITKNLHINSDLFIWNIFQVCRTSLIFVVGKMISAQNCLEDVWTICKGVVKNCHFSDMSLMMSFDLSGIDWCIIGVGLILLLTVSLLQERGIVIRDYIAKQNVVIRCLIYNVEISSILLMGLYGAGYDASGFAYQIF